MAQSLREIRSKIKGFKSTRQVTKAMELVSASKMRRAVQNAVTLRRYARTAWAILRRVAGVNSGTHPFLTERPVRHVLAILITSDRGLCGSLNTQVFRAVTQYVRGLQDLPGPIDMEYIAVGRKGQQFLARTGQKVVAAFPALSNHARFRDVLPVSKMALDGFQAGTYDHVVLVYAGFVSALVQDPTVKVLLPFSESRLQEMIDSLFLQRNGGKDVPADTSSLTTNYTFEPSETEVLDRILPQLTELQIYQAVLEAAASEHSARMIAMRNASDNALDIIDDLTLTYNQTRQSKITAELAELSASKAALD